MKKYNVVITAVNRITDGSTPHKSHKPNPSKGELKPQNYIWNALKSLMDEAGAKYVPEEFLKVYIYESGSKDLSYLDDILKAYPQVELIKSDKKLTLVENTNRAISEGAKDAEYVMLVQDDVKFARNALFKMDDWVDRAPKDTGFLTLWNCGGRKKGEFVEIPPNTFWGNLTLIFKSKIIPEILSWKKMRLIGSGHDMALKGWAINFKRKIFANPDGLIEHIGDYSSLGQRRIRRSTYWRGHQVQQNIPDSYRAAKLKQIYNKYKTQPIPRNIVPIDRNGKIKVGIAITTYNDVKYTEAALQSLFQNTLEVPDITFYFYLLDDASPDVDTHSLAVKYKKEGLKYYRNPSNSGLTSLWNKAYHLAKGDGCNYLIISNNDVLFSPDWATRIVRTMEKLWSFKVGGPLTNAPGHIQNQHISYSCPNPPISDKMEDIKLISDKIINGRNQKVIQLNGFCMAFKMKFLEAALYHSAGVPFNTDPAYKIYGGEDEFFQRTKPKTIIIGSSYVFHYKQVTMEQVPGGRTNYKKQWVRHK